MEKRFYPRKDFVARVQIQFENQFGQPQQAFGLVEDRSRSGMRISVRDVIKKGTSITISAAFGTFEGVVVRCKRCKTGGYEIGVQFPESPDSATP